MKSKSKTKPTKFAEPYITAAGQAQGPAFEQANAVQQQFQPGLMAAGNLYNDTIGGKYLDGNPYVDGMIEQGDREITDQVTSAFGNRHGSGYWADALGRELADNRTRLRFGNYNQERSNQMDAAGNIGNLAGQATALPQLAAGQYAQNIGGLFGQYNRTTQKQALGPMIIGGAQNAAQAYAASDRRLKMDIEKVGEEADGLGMYRYRYVTDQPDAPLRDGVMADEVAALRPWALGPMRGEFATVNYAAL